MQMERLKELRRIVGSFEDLLFMCSDQKESSWREAMSILSDLIAEADHAALQAIRAERRAKQVEAKA